MHQTQMRAQIHAFQLRVLTWQQTYAWKSSHLKFLLYRHMQQQTKHHGRVQYVCVYVSVGVCVWVSVWM